MDIYAQFLVATSIPAACSACLLNLIFHTSLSPNTGTEIGSLMASLHVGNHAAEEKRYGGRPTQQPKHQRQEAVAKEALPTVTPEALKLQALKHLVRLALSCAVEGRSGKEFERDCQRWSLGGVMLGTSNRSRHFFRECLFIASLVLSHMDALEWDLVLPGIGTASDVAVVLDPVSLGHGWAARHGTVLVMNIVLISPVTFRAFSPFFAAPTMPLGGHAGASVAALAVETMASHPSTFNLNTLRGRLALVGSDGGLAAGLYFFFFYMCNFYYKAVREESCKSSRVSKVARLFGMLRLIELGQVLLF